MTDNNSVKKILPWMIVGLMVIVIGVLIGLNDWETTPSAPSVVPPSNTQTQVSTPQPIKNPIPETKDTELSEQDPPEINLPQLNDSDQPLLQDAALLLPEEKLAQHLAREDIIRKLVVTIDNLDRSGVALDKRAVLPIPGDFFVSEIGDVFRLSTNNYLRYENLTQLLTSIDSDQAAQLYFRYYPLFQEAYQELGYPEAYFNDRLVEVIDHLATWSSPDAGMPVLTRPKSAYVFESEALESLSVGRKALVNMGPANAKRIQSKLLELRGILATNQKN